MLVLIDRNMNKLSECEDCFNGVVDDMMNKRGNNIY